jgi:hypothetical protein
MYHPRAHEERENRDGSEAAAGIKGDFPALRRSTHPLDECSMVGVFGVLGGFEWGSASD